MGYAIYNRVWKNGTAVAHYLDGFGLVPVVGTGGGIARKLLSESFQATGAMWASWPVLTDAEVDEFDAKHFPAALEYRIEQRELSMSSAAL